MKISCAQRVEALSEHDNVAGDVGVESCVNLSKRVGQPSGSKQQARNCLPTATQERWAEDG